MLAYLAGILTGLALAHPAVRAWVKTYAHEVYEWARAKMGSK